VTTPAALLISISNQFTLRASRPSRSGAAVSLRIPTQGGQVFRFHRGHHSDLIAATIPI